MDQLILPTFVTLLLMICSHIWEQQTNYVDPLILSDPSSSRPYAPFARAPISQTTSHISTNSLKTDRAKKTIFLKQWHTKIYDSLRASILLTIEIIIKILSLPSFVVGVEKVTWYWMLSKEVQSAAILTAARFDVEKSLKFVFLTERDLNFIFQNIYKSNAARFNGILENRVKRRNLQKFQSLNSLLQHSQIQYWEIPGTQITKDFFCEIHISNKFISFGAQSFDHFSAQTQLCSKNYLCGFSYSKGLSYDQTTPWIQNFASKFFGGLIKANPPENALYHTVQMVLVDPCERLISCFW